MIIFFLQMISTEVPVMFSKILEIFITELTMRSWLHTEESKRRTVQVRKREKKGGEGRGRREGGEHHHHNMLCFKIWISCAEERYCYGHYEERHV